MRYVTVRKECRSTEGGILVKLYKVKKLGFFEKAAVCVALIAALVFAYSLGIYVGAKATADVVAEVTEQEVEIVEDTETDQFNPAVPLSVEEQQALYDAATEFGVDYYTMLGLIERETNFRNVSGDGGKASGYCQVWRKWWGGLMREIGASDLNVPKDNFRTACAIMAELTEQYGSEAGALTAYNQGSYNGTVTRYATAVLENAEKWRQA